MQSESEAAENGRFASHKLSWRYPSFTKAELLYFEWSLQRIQGIIFPAAFDFVTAVPEQTPNAFRKLSIRSEFSDNLKQKLTHRVVDEPTSSHFVTLSMYLDDSLDSVVNLDLVVPHPLSRGVPATWVFIHLYSFRDSCIRCQPRCLAKHF